MVAVSPEASLSPDSLVQAAERGKLIFVVAGVGDGMSSWANGVGVPAIAYPPSEVDTNKLLDELRRADAGNPSTGSGQAWPQTTSTVEPCWAAI